jgi:hypothetical protein
MCQSVFDQANDDVIGHQTTSIHDFFCGDAERRSFFDRSAQHIAGRNLWDVEFLFDKGSLRAFTGTWRSQQDEPHGESLFVYAFGT